MQQDRALRRNAVIVGIVIVLLLIWPSVFRLLPHQSDGTMDIGALSKNAIGSWESSEMTLSMDQQGMCVWNKDTPDPCGFAVADDVPSSIAQAPLREGVYLITGESGKQRAYQVLSADAESMTLLSVSTDRVTNYARKN